MKKMLVVLVVLFVCVGVVGAATVEVGSNGEVRVSGSSAPVTWKQTGVTIADEMLPYGDAWRKAYAAPNVVVPVKSHNIVARDGFFHTKTTPVVDLGVIYDTHEHEIRMAKGVVAAKPEINFMPYLVFWLLAIAAATMAFIVKSKNIAALAAIFNAFAAAFATFNAFAAAFAALAALAAFNALAADKKKSLITLYAAFLVLMATSLVFFLLS
jgi:hypothetical protein